MGQKFFSSPMNLKFCQLNFSLSQFSNQLDESEVTGRETSSGITNCSQAESFPFLPILECPFLIADSSLPFPLLLFSVTFMSVLYADCRD